MSALRVLVVCHSHPELTHGGAEIAAHALFKTLNEQPDIESWFLGCARNHAQARLGSVLSQPFTEREFVYTAGAFDWFHFANHDPRFPRQFEALLRDIQPDIVHFHHYINLGVEAFQIVRRVLPQARIVLTLHEYLAICHHYGQMITTGRHTLCHEATPARCHHCFPQKQAADFFLRRTYIQSFLDDVDDFISPSHFLAQRYIAWGIPAARMSVIENIILPPSPQHIPHLAPHLAKPDSFLEDEIERSDFPFLHIGFFGQISWLKGCNVLFDAAEILERDGVDDIVIDVHGDYRNQMPEFQAEFLKRLEKAGRNIVFHGPYDNQRVDALMAAMDAIVVPSVWWENSPVVIQEALRNRRPVLCSALGGMAEKIRDGLDGFHFRPGSGAALAALLRRLATDRPVLRALSTSLRHPPGVEAIIHAHLDVYRPQPMARDKPGARKSRKTGSSSVLS